MTKEEISLFKQLFSKYCREEINNGKCDDADCAFCQINRAYDEIFEYDDD